MGATGTARPPATPGQRRGASGRGRARRGALVEAAAGLLAEQGIGAVSHRALAQRAGVPLAATTYYFASLEEVHEEALRHLAGRWLDRAGTVLSALPARLADVGAVARAVVALVVGPVDDGRPEGGADLLAVYERYLEAGRHPHLRPLVLAVDEQLDGLVGQVLGRGGLPGGPATARTVLALVDGALLRALGEGRPARPAAEGAVEAHLALLPPAGPRGAR